MVSQADLLALCRHSLLGYAIAQWDGYQVAAHHRLIASALERVARGECSRLIITMPPRHGKSQLASEFFPAWYFGLHPERQIIHATYAQELADGFGRKVRNQIRSDLYQALFPGSVIADDSQAAGRFHTARGGVYHAVGVGGAATGRGAHLLLIDDPIRGREDAESEAMRSKLKDWYKSVAYTRLMPGGAIVLIQTRWHMDDLAGWILAEHQHEPWEVLSLPAIDEQGTALWPEMYPLKRLAEIRETVGPRDWEALYQQRPVAVLGGDFKVAWLQHYGRINSREMSKVMLVDPASGKRQSNDFTSAWVIGLGTDGNYYVLDAVRDRLNLTERADMVFALHRKWSPAQVRYERYGMMADVEYLRAEMDRRSYRFALREVGGQVAKQDRIRRLVPLFEQGRIWLPPDLEYATIDGKSVDLIADFIKHEYSVFPSATHDDMLDALARIAEPTIDLPWPRKQDAPTEIAQTFEFADAAFGY